MRLALALICASTTAWADAPVVDAVVVRDGRFDVTISHPDTGWDHYADGWAVEDAQGNQLGLRVLAHPHETEQPFTRSLTIAGPLPDRVFVRARCIVDGLSDVAFEAATR